MSNFQTPYSKIAWLETQLKSLKAKVEAVTNGASLRSTTVTGVLTSHSHKGAGDGGLITYLRFVEGAAPATPPSGHVHLYAKTDGRMYSKDDAGVESGPL